MPAQAVPEQQPDTVAELSRITTLYPRTDNEARTIGENFREGVPVIMNLSEMDDNDAKRLVDFAAGLVFAFTMMSMSVSAMIVVAQIGTTIGLGLLFDTLVIRAFMTPSIAALLGRWFWWPQIVRTRPAPTRTRIPPTRV